MPIKLGRKKSTNFTLSACFYFGARGRNRTGTLLPARDFESRASTNSATRALLKNTLLYNLRFRYYNKLWELCVQKISIFIYLMR